MQAFKSIHLALSSGMKLDTSTLAEANRLYGHVLKTLKADALLEDPENPAAHSQADRDIAQRKLEALSETRRDAEGKTDLIATFMALSQVDDGLRTALQNTPAPKVAETPADSVDGAVTWLMEAVVNLLTRLSISRRRRPRDVGRQLDQLADALSEVEGDRRWLATANMFRVLDPANDYVAEKAGKGVKAAVDRIGAARKAAADRGSRRVESAWGAAELVTSIANADTAEASAQWVTKLMNAHPRLNTLRSLVNDLKGMDGDNTLLMRLINPVKSEIDSIRQHFREIIPKTLAGHFSRKLSDTEWKHLFMGLGRADILALGRDGALDLLADPSQADNRILEAEEALLQIPLGRQHAQAYRAKAEVLAEYMVNRRVTSTNPLRNAKAIAHLFDEDGRPAPKDVTPELIEAIDRLTTLYAFRKLDPATNETLAKLSSEESGGVGILVGYHNGVRAKEIERNESAVATNNGWKGHVPSVQQDGASVIVARPPLDERNPGPSLDAGKFQILAIM
ncbi:MAG: hypothetical protein ACQEUZ_01665 [Pseudomonadota bacterium]